MIHLSLVAGTLLAATVRAQLAGNENYALEARASLHRVSASKRDEGVTFSPSSVSFAFGNKTYLSPTGPQFKQYSLQSDWGLDSYAGKLLPVTVFDVEGEVTCDVLGDLVAEYMDADDVWDPAFLSAAVLTTSTSFHVASDVSGCVSGWGGNLIIKNGNATSDVSGIGLAHVDGLSVPPGPYLASINGGVTLTEAYRTYRDEAQAFTTAAVAGTDGTFVDLTTPVIGLNTLTIPVPSRLYTKYLPDPRPLEGRRIAVKDLFDMAGLKTGGGNRAYFNTYPAKETTAVAIQRLVDQGGVIVGRVKTSQFANGESATADWVDQMCPFNPRGDGYQQPSSSSSGPGAAIGAYDWLDHTIGSDTGGSIIDPATVGGTYGLRPTWNAISLTGAIPLQATQDTAGFFARNATAGASFARGWYGDRFNNYTSYPTTLILPNSTWTFDEDYAGANQFNAFKSGLIDLLKPSSLDGRDFEGFWNATGYYDQVGQQSATDYLNTTYANLITYYQWNNLGKPWFEDYAAQNDGRVPFVDPSPLARWTYARDNLTEGDFNASAAEKATWKEFIDTQVLITDNQTCSNAVYAYPYGLGDTAYRNIYKKAPGVPFGFGYPAQFSGVPQLVIPIGQIAYESTITNHTEYLPLAVTMFAANGCDYLLWDIAAALEKANVTQTVAAGTLAYPDRI